MLSARHFSLTPVLAWTLLFPADHAICALQQPSNSSPNPQDVPQHQPQGTNNPDISKQRRPGPTSPRAQNPDQNSADVPHQQPGSDNPDLGSQRNDDKTHMKGTATTSTAKNKKTTQKHAKNKAKSTSAQ